MKDGVVEPRYTITHKDGKPIDPSKRYFVLAVDSDPYAKTALREYALECQTTHPTLARSMNEEYGLELREVTLVR